jgi:hypothetical protein
MSEAPYEQLERIAVDMAEYMRDRFFGKYRGTVRDVDDPEKMGRIKASVPAVYGENDSPWALPCVPFAGPSHGLVLLPEIDDGVWIEFEGGDPSHPIWSGCYWARDELPDPGGDQVRALITPSGHQVVLDDDGGTLQLVHSGGAELTMTDSDITLKIGSTKVELSSSGVSINDGAFEVK